MTEILGGIVLQGVLSIIILEVQLGLVQTEFEHLTFI